MSRQSIVAMVVAAWFLIGLASALWMERSGHRHPVWILVALILGPLAAPVLRERAETQPREVTGTDSTGEAPTHAARLGVVVGLDGSDESETAFETAATVFRPDRHVLHLVEVLDYDAAQDQRLLTDADARLAEHQSRIPEFSSTRHVLAGRAADAIIEFAADHDAALIVVGPRGRGMSTRLIGSALSELLRRSPTPVVVAAAPARSTGSTPTVNGPGRTVSGSR